MNNHQLALLDTLRHTIIKIRILGYQGQKDGITAQQAEVLADLADAIHNIPDALKSENPDLEFQTEIMLGGFVEKYKHTADYIDLLGIYKNKLQELDNEL